MLQPEIQALELSTIYGWATVDNEDLSSLSKANKTLQAAEVNLIWQPVKKFNIGIEYAYGKREIEDGTEGTLKRVTCAAKYLF